MQKLLLRTRGLAGPGVRSADLILYEGDFAVILGSSGELLGLLGFAQPPAEGDIFLEGRLVTGLTPSELAQLRAQYIGQVGPFPPATPAAERTAAIKQIRPRILLADEPLAGLDPAGDGAPVLDLLWQLNRGGLTILMTTADPEAAAYGNRLYRMSDGILTAIMEV